jgi:hypothetical protein
MQPDTKILGTDKACAEKVAQADADQNDRQQDCQNKGGKRSKESLGKS